MTYLAEIQADPTLVWTAELGEESPATTAVDDEGGNNGTYTNTAGLVRGAQGLILNAGRSCGFLADASNGHVSVPDNTNLDIVAGYTIESWIYLDSLATIATIIAHQATNAGFVFRVVTDGKLRFTTQWVSSFKNHDSDAGAIAVGKIYQVVARLNLDLSVDLFRNGDLIKSITAGASAPGLPAASMFISSRDAAGTEELAGRQQRPAIYSSALTNDRIKSHWLVGSTAHYIASLGRRPVPMIKGPDTDKIMGMYR